MKPPPSIHWQHDTTYADLIAQLETIAIADGTAAAYHAAAHAIKVTDAQHRQARQESAALQRKLRAAEEGCKQLQVALNKRV